MKILLANKFFYPKGGADVVFLNNAALLSKKGHDISYFSMRHDKNLSSSYDKYFVSNVDLDKKNLFISKVKIAQRILYSFEAKNRIKMLLKQNKPDIVHLHNIYHQISPSILHVFKKYNIPVVMTLHDYKLVCSAYSLLNNGKPCQKCENGKYYNCLLNRCTKNSYSKSFLNVIEMYLHHKILRIYDLVNVFISPSKFLKFKLEELEFKRKIVHLPNFVDIKTFNPVYRWHENSIIYFGRLSKEKGLLTLIDAVKDIENITLKIIGEGPIEENLRLKVKGENLSNICFLGYKAEKELKNEIKKSMFVILPSEGYENNPMSIIEAFALGKPAIGARIGGIPELVKDNKTGLTFEAGNSDDLKSKIIQLINNPSDILRMGKNARKLVEDKYGADKHYNGLMRIYEEAIKEAKEKRK